MVSRAFLTSIVAQTYPKVYFFQSGGTNFLFAIGGGGGEITLSLNRLLDVFMVKFMLSLLGHLQKHSAGGWILYWRSKVSMTTIFVHGSGHKATSWDTTISYMESNQEILCPDLASILKGKEATWANLYSSFVEYCNLIDGPIKLCGLSLGGILACNYTLDFPEKVKALVLIGAPYKIPKLMFSIQNVVFRFLPKSVFEQTAFSKKEMFIFGNSIKNLDFSDRVQNIKCPTLIVCGEKDGINKKSAYYFAENIGNAKLVIMENTGHVVNEENPKTLAKELDEFF